MGLSLLANSLGGGLAFPGEHQKHLREHNILHLAASFCSPDEIYAGLHEHFPSFPLLQHEVKEHSVNSSQSTAPASGISL